VTECRFVNAQLVLKCSNAYWFPVVPYRQ